MHPFTAFILAAPGRFQRRNLVKGINTQRCQLRCTQLTQHKFRLVITQHARFLPFHFQPRRVSEHQVKTAALGKQVAELQIPVEETVLLSQGIDNRQTRQMAEQHIGFQTTSNGKQRRLFSQQAFFGKQIASSVLRNFSDFFRNHNPVEQGFNLKQPGTAIR